MFLLVSGSTKSNSRMMARVSELSAKLDKSVESYNSTCTTVKITTEHIQEFTWPWQSEGSTF